MRMHLASRTAPEIERIMSFALNIMPTKGILIFDFLITRDRDLISRARLRGEWRRQAPDPRARAALPSA